MCIRDRGRVNQLLCHAHADEARQTLRAAEARRDAQTHFRLAEDGVVGAEADVAAHSQLIAAAQRDSFSFSFLFCVFILSLSAYSLVSYLFSTFSFLIFVCL